MDNTIFINGAITQATLLEIGKLLRNISRENTDPVNLVINSQGGDIQATLGIIDCIDSIPNKVYTYALAKCSSAAVFIFLNGDKRYVFKNTIFTIHEPFMSVDNASSFILKDLIFEYEKLSMYNQRIFDLFEKKANIKKNFLQKKYAEGNWLLVCEDSMKLGIATDIVSNLP